MPELGPYGSVRGARSNARPYRDHSLTAPPRLEISHRFLTRRDIVKHGPGVMLGPFTFTDPPQTGAAC
jgi:hypothetical protein